MSHNETKIMIFLNFSGFDVVLLMQDLISLNRKN